MIRVTVDLLRGDDENDVVPIGVLEIARRTLFGQMCDYDFRIREAGGTTPWLIVRSHRRSDGVWPLIARALAALPTAELSDYQCDRQRTDIGDAAGDHGKVEP